MTGITTKDHIKVLLVGLINTERPKKNAIIKGPTNFILERNSLLYLTEALIELDTNCNYPFM